MAEAIQAYSSTHHIYCCSPARSLHGVLMMIIIIILFSFIIFEFKSHFVFLLEIGSLIECV